VNYADWLSAVQTILVIQDATGIANLNIVIPRAIEAAELRMYRDSDLDFLFTRTTDITQQTAAGSRNVNIPSQFVVVENVNLVTPASTTPTSGGSRIPLLRTTLSFIDQIWPNETSTQAPQQFQTYFAVYEEETAAAHIRIAPTPDSNYYVEFRGTQRPAALSSTNSTTPLTTYLPDMFLAASLVFLAGYQRDFGAQSDDPKLAQSWEAQYQGQKRSAAFEEARKKALSGDYSALPLPPALMPPGMPAMPRGR